MFFTSNFSGTLGLDGYARMINMLGAGSIMDFAVPCVLLLVGIRTTPFWYVVLVAANLAAEGVAMYDDGSLDSHLGAIMASAVVIIAGLFMLGLRTVSTSKLPCPAAADDHGRHQRF